ncbi:MAG: hypothetical protein ACYC3L_11200 [Gemmatimonadaceae bacterium]
MLPSLPPSLRRRHRLRRIAALALFALQGAVALSPIAEPVHTGRPVAHVEEQGSTHVYSHDESTCAVCIVGSLHALVPGGTAGIATPPGRHDVLSLVSRAAPAPDVVPANHSRAPPLAG